MDDGIDVTHEEMEKARSSSTEDFGKGAHSIYPGDLKPQLIFYQ